MIATRANAFVTRHARRFELLPTAAAAILLTGALLRVGGRPELAHRLWYAGLLVTGAPVVWRTLGNVVRGHLATDLVAMLAVAGAIALGEPLAGLVIVLMQTGGEALERFAEGKASSAVRELERAAPRIAHRVRDGVISDLPVADVRIGDTLYVRPGELVPCDVVVVEGRSAVDVSRLTGEPMPLQAEPGTLLPSGSGNGEGPLTVRSRALASESQYARIVELVRGAQAHKAPLQRLADRYAIWFTPATILVCAVAWLWSGDPRRALAVLVVATPCPLILATPIAIIGGINRAARRQVIVRHGGAMEQLASITTVVLDKTGTLTIGQPAVSRVVALPPWGEHDALRLAGAVAVGSGHLLARTLVHRATETLARLGQVLPTATAMVEAAGRGVRGKVEGHEVVLGARTLLVEHRPGTADEMDAIDAQVGAFAGGARAYMAVDGQLAGVVEYADRVRPDATAVVRDLRALGGRRVMMLSGDHTANAAAVAEIVGITEVQGDLLPADKESIVRSLVAAGERVLMVGDGTNDAPAMSSATVGVSLAAHGGGITAEAADVVVLADELGRIPEAIRISRRTMRVAHQSLSLGLGLSAVAMIVAAFGYIQPSAGALLQEGIDVAAILNALRASRAPRSAGESQQQLPGAVLDLHRPVAALVSKGN